MNHAHAGNNLVTSSALGLARVVALIAAFFGGPILWQQTIVYVRAITYQTYGESLIGLASLAWYGLSFMLVYYVAQISVGTAIVTGFAALVVRFMI